MIVGLAYAVVGLALITIGWGLVTALIKKPISWAQLIAAGALELGVLGQSIIAGVRLVGGYRPVELGTTIGYLIAIVVLVPLGALWALSDRTRWAGIVLAVAGAAVGAMSLRLLVLWG